MPYVQCHLSLVGRLVLHELEYFLRVALLNDYAYDLLQYLYFTFILFAQVFECGSLFCVLFQFNVCHLCVWCVCACRLRDLSNMFLFLILVFLCVLDKESMNMLVPEPLCDRAWICVFILMLMSALVWLKTFFLFFCLLFLICICRCGVVVIDRDFGCGVVVMIRHMICSVSSFRICFQYGAVC